MVKIGSHFILMFLVLINKDSIDYHHNNSYHWLYKFVNVLHFAETKIYANDLICIDTECNTILLYPLTSVLFYNLAKCVVFWEFMEFLFSDIVNYLLWFCFIPFPFSTKSFKITNCSRTQPDHYLIMLLRK